MVPQHLADSQQTLRIRGSETSQPHLGISLLAWLVLLLILSRLQDAHPGSAQTSYDHVWNLFVRGQLLRSQEEAELEYKHFQTSDPTWATRFRLLQAEVVLHRGLFQGALDILSATPPPIDTNVMIRKLALEGATFTRLQRFSEADLKLAQAEGHCSAGDYAACGDVLRARGVLAIDRGQPGKGRQLFLESLAFAREHHDRFLEATALLNLGASALQSDHYDEAADWSKAAQLAASELGADDMLLIASGNLAFAYDQLGDHDRALEIFLVAEKRAAELGDLRFELKWLENIGYVYQTQGDSRRAALAYQQALELARRINSRSDIAITLDELAYAAIDAGKLGEADSYLNQVTQLAKTSGNREDQLWVELARGRIAALHGQHSQAEALFRAVLQDPDSQTSMKLEAGYRLALLDETDGHVADADKAYKSALATFEQARRQLKNEDSRLPFLANATSIYDDYVHFLVQRNSPLHALAVADQSRARTLEQGLGIVSERAPLRPAAFDPRSVARATDSTLLFYWLGEKQSYLWVIAPAKVALFPLPPRPQIAARVESYRKTLLDMRDPLESGNADGEALYQMLVAPAAAIIRPRKPVILLDEGILSKLNFETLLVPGPEPSSKAAPDSPAQFHYLIEDLTLSSAPSLAMLGAAKPASGAGQRMLLLGNPVSPDRDFPTLPMFSFEMSRVGSHFARTQLAAFSGPQATPATYIAAQLQQYSYIHFVSHAVASSTSPLDSAIILSNPAGQEDSYKLYAREIIQHPIDAKLVTISACYGSGTRAYAGEGLVGLSWAFLRAGARQVIGALWEVSDDSTPRLMDSLYQGLANGESPAVALRSAKLQLLHSQSRFRVPFYWAPFQIYGRQ